MASLHLVHVLETSDVGKTDNIYLSEVISHYFEYKNSNYDSVSSTFLFMDGKHNYNDSKLEEHINSLKSMFKDYDGITKVIYYFDTDSVDRTYKHGSFFYNVQQYCEERGYDLVWFCKNAENVFLNKEPESLSDKLEAAKEFGRNNKIEKIEEYKLSKTTIEYGCSNILIVLDKYLRRKE